MQKVMIPFIALSISTLLCTGCASSKTRVFGRDMPTMKEIHDAKFKVESVDINDIPQRPLSEFQVQPEEDFQWLPNPTLQLYVFKHLTASGHPVPGYTTFFKLYTTDMIAEPGELGGWE